MPDSNRWEPFIDGKRACRKCGTVKQQEDFHFNKTQGYYAGSCKDCTNEHRKVLYHLDPDIKRQMLDNRKEYLKVYTKDNTEYRTTRILATCKKLDADRGLEFSLTREFVRSTVKEPCVYCNDESTGLDRLDNKLGHTDENCVPCCKECNVARMDNFTHEEMFIIGKAIRVVKDARKQGNLLLSHINELLA